MVLWVFANSDTHGGQRKICPIILQCSREEEECIDIKFEDGIYSEGEEDDMNTQEEENVDIEEEVSCGVNV